MYQSPTFLIHRLARIVPVAIILLAIFAFAVPIQMALAVIQQPSSITVNDNIKINLPQGLNATNGTGLNCNLAPSGGGIVCDLATGTTGTFSITTVDYNGPVKSDRKMG